jgi:hypothetical protein
MGSITAGTITGGTIQTASSGARVVLSSAAQGGLIGYGASDTYNPATGSGSYQVLWKKSDGKLYFGGGVGVLDENGETITGPTFSYGLSNLSPVTVPRANTLQWSKSSGSQAASLVGSASAQLLALADHITLAIPISSTDAYGLDLNLNGQHRMAADKFTIDSGGATGPTALTVQTSVSDGGVTTVHGGLNIGSATGAGVGQIKGSSSLQMTSGLFTGGLTVGGGSFLSGAGELNTTSHGTIGGGLNVGTASGATAGQVKASAGIYPSWGTGSAQIQTRDIVSLANNGVAQLVNATGDQFGLVLVMDATNGQEALYFIRGGAHATQEVSDPGAVYTNAAGGAASTNIYWSAGNNRYELENKIGSTQTYHVIFWSYS